MAQGLGWSQWRPEDIQRMNVDRLKREREARERAEEAKRQAVNTYRTLRTAYHARAWR